MPRRSRSPAIIFLLAADGDVGVRHEHGLDAGGLPPWTTLTLARFRESVRAGKGAAAARAEALETSGVAVTFSGIAVIISLGGLWMVDNQALRSMALGAMIVVAIAILVAITLLPAPIRVLGHRVEAGGIAWRVLSTFRRVRRKPRRRGSTNPNRQTFWERWTYAVMRRPVLSVVAVSAILLTMAIPVLSVTTGNGAIKQFDKNDDARVGTELAAKVRGGGADPVGILATLTGEPLPTCPANAAAIADLSRLAAEDSEVAAVARPVERGADAAGRLDQWRRRRRVPGGSRPRQPDAR